MKICMLSSVVSVHKAEFLYQSKGSNSIILILHLQNICRGCDDKAEA